MRGLILSSAATTPRGGHGTWPENLGSVKVGAGPAARLSVNVAPGQFGMILMRKRTRAQASSSKRSSSDQDASSQAPGAASPSCESSSAQAPG